MIYPIVAYGSTVLREKAKNVEKEEVDLKKIAESMFQTMYAASGVGLAAPQVGMSIRLFVVDGQVINDSTEDVQEIDATLVGFKKVFINAEIIEETGQEWSYEEGCLSIPGVRGDVYRPERIKIRYRDLDWNEHLEIYEGMAARIIQHEYDHIEGILFTDHLSPLKKQVLRHRLAKISKGQVEVSYRMRFPKK